MELEWKTSLRDFSVKLSNLLTSANFPDIAYEAVSLSYDTTAAYFDEILTLDSTVADYSSVVVTTRKITSGPYTGETYIFMRFSGDSNEDVYVRVLENLPVGTVRILNKVVNALPYICIQYAYNILDSGNIVPTKEVQAVIPVKSFLAPKASAIFSGKNSVRVESFTEPFEIVPVVTNSNSESITDANNKIASFLAYIYNNDSTSSTQQTLYGYLYPEFFTIYGQNTLTYDQDEDLRGQCTHNYTTVLKSVQPMGLTYSSAVTISLI